VKFTASSFRRARDCDDAESRIPYNRLKLIFGGSVNDDFDYFFDMCAEEDYEVTIANTRGRN